MRVDYQIISADEFVRADVHGRVDFHASKEAFSELVRDDDLPRNQKYLFDFRRCHCRISVGEVYYLVRHVSKQRGPLIRQIAMVLEPKVADSLGDFAEDAAANQGLLMRAFTDVTAAHQWLAVGEPSDGDVKTIESRET